MLIITLRLSGATACMLSVRRAKIFEEWMILTGNRVYIALHMEQTRLPSTAVAASGDEPGVAGDRPIMATRIRD